MLVSWKVTRISGSRGRQGLVVLPLVLFCFLTIPGPSLATLTITMDPDGVLTISSDAADSVRISSDASGYLLINGLPPEGLQVLVTDITKIIVNGGPGANVIDLVDVTSTTFTSLTDNNLILHGAGGNDVMIGSEFDDYMYGEAGNDTQHGGDGNDSQEGGEGNDSQYGDAGDDTQLGGNGSDTQYGGDGIDTQFGEGGNDTQYGGPDADEQHGGDGTDIQYGEAGDDIQYGDDGADTQWGGDGADTQDGGAGNDRQFGQAGNDTQFGRDGDDQQWGSTGGDEQWGGPGHDEQYGDEGDDVQWGEAGNDTQWGSDGDDEQHGSDGDDIHRGGDGDDRYYLVPGGDDAVIESAGNDTLDFSEATAGIRIDLDLQYLDQTVEGRNTVRLEGQIENFVGSQFDDMLFIGPLDVPRYASGGPHAVGDTLMFADVGVNVTYDDSTITAEGYAVVTYEDFEFLGFGGVGVDELEHDVPTTPALSQNHPNPLRTHTTIQFGVREAGRVILKLYDLQGHELQTLLDRFYVPGTYRVLLAAGELPSGCYLYAIEMGGVRSTRRIVVVQ